LQASGGAKNGSLSKRAFKVLPFLRSPNGTCRGAKISLVVAAIGGLAWLLQLRFLLCGRGKRRWHKARSALFHLPSASDAGTRGSASLPATKIRQMRFSLHPHTSLNRINLCMAKFSYSIVATIRNF
jgi:hypothetical protein